MDLSHKISRVLIEESKISFNKQSFLELLENNRAGLPKNHDDVKLVVTINNDEIIFDENVEITAGWTKFGTKT